MMDGWVVLDRRHVVKDEWTREAVVVRHEPRRNHHDKRDKSLSFHKAKRLGDVTTRRHLKFHRVVRIRVAMGIGARLLLGWRLASRGKQTCHVDLLARGRKRGIMTRANLADVAQLVEQRFRKP